MNISKRYVFETLSLSKLRSRKIHKFPHCVLCILNDSVSILNLGNANYTEQRMWHDFSFKSMFEVSLFLHNHVLKIQKLLMKNLGFEVQTLNWIATPSRKRREDHHCSYG